MADKEITPRHQWVNGGREVLILRFVAKDGSSYGGFKHPLTVGERVTAPDWNTNIACGGGIHGWPWGLSLGDGKESDWSATWQVYGVDPKDVIGGSGELAGKCKFKTGILRFVGDWHGAMLFVLSGQMAWVEHAASGAASNSGASGAASNSGENGAASNSGASGAASNSGASGAASNSGWSGAASNSGWSGAASNSGWRGAASNSGASGAASNSGENGAASNSGWRGAAVTTGEYSIVETSPTGIAASTAEEFTWISHPGAVLLMRWQKNGGGHRVLKAKKTALDGERLTFRSGRLIKREKLNV
jgi:hypothetical protein